MQCHLVEWELLSIVAAQNKNSRYVSGGRIAPKLSLRIYYTSILHGEDSSKHSSMPQGMGSLLNNFITKLNFHDQQFYCMVRSYLQQLIPRVDKPLYKDSGLTSNGLHYVWVDLASHVVVSLGTQEPWIPWPKGFYRQP